MNKIKVGILGVTGMVGQSYVKLLQNHPWFDVVDFAASSNSAGKIYSKVVSKKWLMDGEIPKKYLNFIIRDIHNFEDIPNDVKLFFSALDLKDKESTRNFEFSYAKKGYALVSNSSANRWTDDVPMIIPEINPHHTEIIFSQQQIRKLPSTGFVTVKPNCSIQSYLIGLFSLQKSGYPLKDVQVTTLQALSGAGAKGITNPEWHKNIIPFIKGEEEKTEQEPLKILGKIQSGKIKKSNIFNISATCIRVPVIHGHSAVVQINFESNIPSKEEIIKIWNTFKPDVYEFNLPSAPKKTIIYRKESDRPQVKADVNNQNGMAITFGRLKNDKFFDYKIIGLSHNTIRGAAGGAILTAELLVKKGFIKYG